MSSNEIAITEIPGVIVVEPRVFPDARGKFLETYQRDRYAQATMPFDFVQDNYSVSKKGVLRGLHYQHPHPQGKLVMVLVGEIYDVVVDLRRDSPTFGRWGGITLDDVQHRQIYVPPGLAHGFYTVSDAAHVLYKCSASYSPKDERTVRWDDADLRISWPAQSPIMSEKDLVGNGFRSSVMFEKGDY